MQTLLTPQKALSMPAEFSPHCATIMIFPQRPGSWGRDPRAAQTVFARIANRLARRETVYMIVNAQNVGTAKTLLSPEVRLLEHETDDAWARDTAPTFTLDSEGALYGIDWNFNAWGGAYDGLYKDYENDRALAGRLCEAFQIPCFHTPFVMEGGAVHSDGEGTLLVTEECLLSPGRNPGMSKDEIDRFLREVLGAQKVIFLPYGIVDDETNGHVDNICAFLGNNKVALAWSEDENDPQYARSRADWEVLTQETDAKGRTFDIIKLPLPMPPLRVTEQDYEKFSFAEGEAVRTPGERLAASYVNFYFGNDCVLLPQFGGIYAETDARAAKILREVCPGREVAPVPARDILLGGGNIHCITQQIPKPLCGVFSEGGLANE